MAVYPLTLSIAGSFRAFVGCVKGDPSKGIMYICLIVGWLVVLGLMALGASISVYLYQTISQRWGERREKW